MALLVVTVRSSAVRAWIWRWMAAGFSPACTSVRMALSWSVTASCRSARRCGVLAVSYFLVTFAPSRTLEISFCCALK